MERILDVNALLLEQNEISLQDRLILEALQTIKNSKPHEDVFVRQAIIMLDHMLLKFIIDMYGNSKNGNSKIDSYERLSELGFEKTGDLEGYLVDYQNSYPKTTSPNTKDISFIHNSVRIQTNAYHQIYLSLSSLSNDKKFITVSSKEERKGKGRAQKYQISSTGSQMVIRIKNKSVKTIIPKKILNSSFTFLPLAILSLPGPNTQELVRNAEKEIANANYLGALKLYTQAIERSKKETGSVNPELYYNKGLCLSMLGNSGEALECYRSALMVDPTYMESYFAIGAFYHSRSDFVNAVVNLQKAHQMQPQNIAVVLLLSETLCKLNREREAARLFLENEQAILNECNKVLSSPASIVRKNLDIPSSMPEYIGEYHSSGREKHDRSRRVIPMCYADARSEEKKSFFKRKIQCEERPVYGSGKDLDPSLSRQQPLIKNVETLSFNIGIACIDNKEYEQARQLLKIAQNVAPNDQLVKFVLEDMD